MDQALVEKLEQARRRTVGNITSVAQSRHNLETIRKDINAQPEVIQHAAQTYREAERVMKESIEAEIQTIIEVALSQQSANT